MPISDYVNLQTIGTKIMWAVLCLFGLAGYAGYGAYVETGENTAYIADHKVESAKAIQDLGDGQKRLDDKLARILDTLERDYYLIGTGSVGTFGGSESYIRINRGRVDWDKKKSPRFQVCQ